MLEINVNTCLTHWTKHNENCKILMTRAVPLLKGAIRKQVNKLIYQYENKLIFNKYQPTCIFNKYQ